MTGKKKRVKWFWEKEPSEFERMHEILHEIGEPFMLRSGGMKAFRLDTVAPVNISETDRELIVRAELPGFKKDEVRLTITRDTLEMSAEKKHEEIEQNEKFYRKAMGSKAIHRTFTLPATVDTEHVSARLKEGVLTIIMSKLEPTKKRKKAVEIA